MPDDTQLIRELLAEWQSSTAAGDLPQVLRLMSEDVVFLLPGRPPMRGKEAFAREFKGATERFQISTTGTVQEIAVHGDVAYCWSHLDVSVTPRDGGEPRKRTGDVLSILRKEPDGRWMLIRDANMLVAG